MAVIFQEYILSKGNRRQKIRKSVQEKEKPGHRLLNRDNKVTAKKCRERSRR